MPKNSQKRGLALGAILALVASLFSALPASAANAVNGDKIALTPYAGSATNFNGSIMSDFPLTAYMLPGVSTSSGQANFVFEITKVSGNVDIFVGTTSGAVETIDWKTTPSSASSFASISGEIDSTWTTASQFVMTDANAGGDVPIVVRAYTGSASVRDNSSLSAQTAVLSIKVWIENTATANSMHDPLEWYTTQTVTLHANSAVPVTGTHGTMNTGDSVITTSATVGALNFQNIDGTYALYIVSNDDSVLTDDPQGAGITATTSPSALSGNQVTSRSGVVSYSFAVSASAGLPVGTSVSSQVKYTVDSVAYYLGSSFSQVVSNPGVSQLFANVVTSDNSTMSGGTTTATIRTNTTNTFQIGAKTGSASVSKAVSVKLVSVDAGLTAGSKEISINGAALTASYPSAAHPLTVTTGTDGFGTFTLGTSGFVGGETITLTAYVGNVSKSITVEVESATWTLAPSYTTYQSGAGETTAIAYTVTDQWDVKSTRTDQRIKVTRGGTGFNYATTVSYHTLVAGVATVDFVPAPAARTGSALVDAALQHLNPNSGGYVDSNVDASQVTVNVSPTVNAFTTGLAASRSASISYFPNTVSWVTVTGNVANTGSAVAVTGAGLVFRDATGATYSGAVMVRAGSGPTYTFDVAGLTEGTFTMTLTNGTATTTSLVVVDPAAHTAGAAISFDTTAIDAGRTKIIVGTLVDANGNAVDTTQGAGTASILVTYAGTAGIPVGTMPTETDASGQFRISILTSAADSGTFTLTAVYLKDGSSTATADKITKVQTVTVGAAAASSSDQKVNAGSFKGYVAVYAKGYEGQRLSAKVGNDWVVVPALASNFVRVVEFTGAGYTIAVRIYIDRVLVDTITVTTK